MVLPLGWLLVSLFLFAAAYLNLSEGTRFTYFEAMDGTFKQTLHVGVGLEAPPHTLCADGGFGSPYESAVTLSGRNSLLFAAGIFSEASRKAYTCLYGYQTVAGASQLKVPIKVTLLSVFQATLSLILIFLFGLALRNNFKIK